MNNIKKDLKNYINNNLEKDKKSLLDFLYKKKNVKLVLKEQNLEKLII